MVAASLSRTGGAPTPATAPQMTRVVLVLLLPGLRRILLLLITSLHDNHVGYTYSMRLASVLLPASAVTAFLLVGGAVVYVQAGTMPADSVVCAEVAGDGTVFLPPLWANRA